MREAGGRPPPGEGAVDTCCGPVECLPDRLRPMPGRLATMAVLLIGTLDTKGAELRFVRDLLAGAGISCLVLDAGSLGDPAFAPDISADRVFAAAGSSLDAVRAARDRGRAVTLAA